MNEFLKDLFCLLVLIIFILTGTLLSAYGKFSFQVCVSVYALLVSYCLDCFSPATQYQVRNYELESIVQADSPPSYDELMAETSEMTETPEEDSDFEFPPPPEL